VDDALDLHHDRSVTVSLSTRAINRATLARQLLLERHDLAVPEAVSRLAGMQAQEAKPPHIGLWTRLIDADGMAEAIRERRLVRATLMRATLHLTTAEDYLRFRMTVHAALARTLGVLGDRGAGIDPDAVAEASEEVLAAGPLTFTEIRAALAERFPGLDERGLGYTARMLVPLVVVPNDSRWGYRANAPFALATDWLGKKPAARPDVKELARRYLAAYGPASRADFETWSGLFRQTGAFDGLDLERFTGPDGKELFDLPEAPRPDPDVDAPVRYLPEFDNILLSHAKRERIIADEHRPAVITKNLRVKATYLVDGVVAGLWTSTLKRGVATLTLEPFGRLTKRKELEREGIELLRFLEPEAKTYEVSLTS
jgi:hypothetical protein